VQARTCQQNTIQGSSIQLIYNNTGVLYLVASVARLSAQQRTRRRRGKTKADYEAFRASAGGWKDLVDTDKLIGDIYESRRHAFRLPVEL